MQKRPSFSATKEEICDVQSEPIVQKLFEDAIEVLRLAGAYEKDTVEFLSSEVSHQSVEQGLGGDKKQLEKNNRKQVKKPAAVTKSKRRKLERVKAPVTILRKMKQVEVPSEEEQEGAVQRMLNYIHQMPSQETFQPPALPCVSFTLDEADKCKNATNDDPNSFESIHDYTYLSNEKDIALWKMLVASPTNCNVFVGGLDHGVTSETLQAAFEAFSSNEEDKARIKTNVVMDVVRRQSKGYGFVSFPCRRSAELAMICMQDFEIYGRAMQLGWGQENRDEQPSNTEHFRETKINQQQFEKESPLRTLAKPKGDIVSDTVYSDVKEFSPSDGSRKGTRMAGKRKSQKEEKPAERAKTNRPRLKRRSSRWDQETSKRYKRSGESAKLDQSQRDSNQENKEDSLLSEERNPISLHHEEFGTIDSSSEQEELATSDPAFSVNKQAKTQQEEKRMVLVHENETNCCAAVKARNQLSVKLDNETDFLRVSSHSSLDMKETRSELRGTLSSPFGEGQDRNGIGVTAENGYGVRERSSADERRETLCEKASCGSNQTPRRAIQWLTHDQKVAMIKSVCSKFRACGVRGHLGVFGVHYEADNSRLYVVCAKHVTQTQLLDEFKVFGTAEVKLNCDVNGFSKGCAFVQYTDSTNAEKAIKQLHGKVVGGMPIKVMLAEPKVRKGSKENKTVM